MKKLGIIGGGQLGLMMILESRYLPIHFNVLVENRNEPACKIADDVYLVNDYRNFVDNSDIVTFEFEHVDERALDYASQQNKLRPNINCISLKRQRMLEKQFLLDKKLPVGKFTVCGNRKELMESLNAFDRGVIKESAGGYDGKGQYYYTKNNVPEILSDGPFVVEEFVDYDYEASIIGCRTENGDFFSYEPSFNKNLRGMLLWNLGPRKLEDAKDLARKLMDSLDYIGVMGLELFVSKGKVLINEFAPRVHNSGHHTLMGHSISQFELHVRTVMGFPVLEPVAFTNTGIINIIGKTLTDNETEKILSIEGTRLFSYGKVETRRRRKMGHICVSGESQEVLLNNIENIKNIVYGEKIEDYI